MPSVWACSHWAAGAASGMGRRQAWQRLRMVGKSWSSEAPLSTKRTCPGGSSSVLSKVLDAIRFMRSAG